MAALYVAIQVLTEIGWDSLWNELRSASPAWVGATALFLILRWLVWSSRWRLSLSAVRPDPPRLRTTAAILAAAAVNHLTPSFRVFGGLLRARYLSRPPEAPFPSVWSTVLFDQIVNQTVMGSLSAIAFLTMAWRLGRPDQVVAGAIVVAALVLLIPLLIRHLHNRDLVPSRDKAASVAARLGPRFRPIVEGSRDVITVLDKLVRSARLLLPAGLLTLLYAACNVASAWAAFAALGESPPVAYVFLAVSLGVTIGALSGTPGGSLTTEAATVTCYSLLGLDRTTAVAATLLQRGLHYLLVVVLGVPALGLLEMRHRRSAAELVDESGSGDEKTTMPPDSIADPAQVEATQRTVPDQPATADHNVTNR